MQRYITTDCNHTFKWPKHWGRDITGATTDCPSCGKLLILKRTKSLRVHAFDFHLYMHRRSLKAREKDPSPAWPKDGVGTSYVDIP